MRISEVSVRRPVFATVLSMLLVIFGLVSLQRLSVREYPDIDRPTVSITTSYRGASAAIIETKITQVIEDSVVTLAFSSDTMSMLDLTDYAERNIVDRMSTVPGVASVGIQGGRRASMRVWINRQALAARQLTVTDIEDALRRENVELPAGRLESRTREFSLRTMVGLETEQD